MGKKTRIPKWQMPLTVKERKHIGEWCGGTLERFKAARAQQRKTKEFRKAEHPLLDPEPCWTCRSIALKLGLEE